MAFLKAGSDRVSGRLGGRVYRDVGGGDVVVAAAPKRVNRRSPRQMAQRERIDTVNQLWAALPLESIARWRAYAASPSPLLPSPGRERGSGRRTSGVAEFRRLATKYLVVHGGYEAPSEPPASAFLGDGIEIQGGGSRAEGAVAFSASGPNAAGVLTELLVQRLPARHCLPKARDYRSMGFVAFAGEAVTVEVPRGAYACAFRFVRASTGQTSATVPLGTVEVI